MTRRRRRSTPWAEVSGIEPVLPGVSADCLGSKQKQKRVIKQRVSLMEKQRGTTVFPIARDKEDYQGGQGPGYDDGRSGLYDCCRNGGSSFMQ